MHSIHSIRAKLKLTELEKSVIDSMLADSEIRSIRSTLDPEAVVVSDRDFTGAGFFTTLQRSPELKLFNDGGSLRWGKIGARLNAAKIETGYLVYVDDGYVTTVEGYTYGDEWPADVEEIELYELKLGAELENPPK